MTQPAPTSIASGAVLDATGRYRYALTRRLPGPTGDRVLWVMLNPSTADAAVDDPTIRRVCGFSLAAGFRDIAVVNLFAYRTSSPAELRRASKRVGVNIIEHERGKTDWWILVQSLAASRIIVAWGAHGAKWPIRRDAVLRLLPRPLWRLGPPTSQGEPRHPLMLPVSTQLEVHLE